jgi:hypothetical protein
MPVTLLITTRHRASSRSMFGLVPANIARCDAAERGLWHSWAPGALALSLSFEGLGPGRDEWSHRVVPPSRVFDERHGHRVLDLLISIGQAGGNRSETSGEIVFARFLKLGDREAENIGYKQMQEDLFVVLEVLIQARAKSGTCFDELRNELIRGQGHPRRMP